jgi:Icc protein
MIIAQISDPHVRPIGHLYKDLIDSNRMLVDAVDHLNGLEPRPELVLISGDLVDEGHPDEYAALRIILSRLQIPYWVIPGNHDERSAFRRAFSDHLYLPSGEGPLHYSVETFPVRILALDSTVPGQHHGMIDEVGLEWLARSLAADPTRPTIVMLHHPPIPCGIPYMDIYMCREADGLASVLAKFNNVKRIVCGHVHRSFQQLWANSLVCACPSTTTQIALRLGPNDIPASYREPPACLLHCWQPASGMITHLSYIGKFAGPYPFA